jgi:hypothetical protein
MSYARFNDSNWYVYRDGPTDGRAHEQRLTVMHIVGERDTYVFGTNPVEFSMRFKRPYEIERSELVKYIDEFCADVREEFGL